MKLIPLFFPAAILCAVLHAQPFQQGGPRPNLRGNIDRPLRYTPDGRDFVIENGGEFFNRPLYGGNTAFRVDGGDMPEFALYLPGRGGNLRLGIRSTGGRAKWLHETARITARYRPGEMLYEIRDPLLGENALLRVHAVALHQTDGFIVRVEAENLAPVGSLELLAAYGGASGKRGKRDGDIGTEAVPIGEYFQLQPEACRGNHFDIDAARARFTLRAPSAKITIAGQFPPAARLTVADASAWSSAADFRSARPDSPVHTPILISVTPLAANTPLHFSLQRIQDSTTTAVRATSDELAAYRDVTAPGRPGAKPAVTEIPLVPAFAPADLPRILEETVAHFAALRNQVIVETPDPFINAAVAALNVGADAVWDEPQGAVMHGAIAWRSRLLGWRGPYAMDALGWHDRARRHLSYWATRQNTDPIPADLPPPDENANLSRSEKALHSNGDMANSHYDMNTVYVDALFRHILWTGDLGFARKMWPVIERHLAWQRRLFRREFGPEKLPLYESYAQIWASDDLQYHGGGATHGSAYNFYHNTQAARLARALGENDKAAFYDNEAALIARAMRECLWMPDQKMFGEFRDYLGLQRLHESPALWSFYHTLDANLVTSDEAAGMVDYCTRTYFPRAIPVRGPGMPADEHYSMIPSTDWMPYTWSINNVVMGENIHTALALWQAGATEYAFRLTKSSLLASMFMGICPGNIGSLNYLDVYRRESQRDFADGAGVTSRAIVEGLFGVRPDALANELTIAPGFPKSWTRASIRHPDVSYTYERRTLEDEAVYARNVYGSGAGGQPMLETIVIEQSNPKHVTLRLPVRRSTAAVEIFSSDGKSSNKIVHFTPKSGECLIIERLPASEKLELKITWLGMFMTASKDDSFQLPPASFDAPVDWRAPPVEGVKFDPVNLAPHFNDSVTRIFKNEYRSPRSPFVSLAIPKQGIGAWAGHVNATAEIDDTGLRAAAVGNGGLIRLPNGVTFATPGNATISPRNILFTSLWDNYPAEAVIPLEGCARHMYFLMAGSTNWMQSRIDNAELVVTYDDGTTARLALRNPDNWWSIEQDLFYDDYQFRCDTPPPPRVNLKTGKVRILDAVAFKGQGRAIPGGAATVLHLKLDPQKRLRSLTLRTLSNEVIIGLMSVTLERQAK